MVDPSGPKVTFDFPYADTFDIILTVEDSNGMLGGTTFRYTVV